MSTPTQFKALEEVCNVIDPHPSHRAPKAQQAGIPFLGIGDFDLDGTANFSKARIVNEDIFEEHKKRYSLEDDLLAFGRVASIGKVVELPKMNEKYVISPTLAVLKPLSIDFKYLKYAVQSPYFIKQMDEMSTGSTRKSVGMKNLRKAKVPIFTITEQKRIVTVLDQAFADIEKARATAETNLKNARELFDSYSQQLFSQRSQGWVDTTLGEVTGGVFTGPFGSLLHKSDYVRDGIPLVNPAHITSTGIEPDINKTVTKDTAKRLSGYMMSENDIVIGRRGEMGRCAIVTSREAGFLCGTGCFFIKSSKSYNSSYLVRYLRSSSCVQELNRIAGGAVMPNLSNKQLSNLIISIPPLEQQTEILHLIDELSSNIETVTIIYKQKLDSLNELKKSILQKAFSGELTKSKGIAA